jgi:hypothetical protein
MSDEERVQAAAAMEAQNDAVLAEYFETMAPEKQQVGEQTFGPALIRHGIMFGRHRFSLCYK